MALIAIQGIHAKCTGGNSCCEGQCGQGEGDCDWHSDCLPGLECDFDWWWGDDFCKAGPNTKNYKWNGWQNWSKCSVQCGVDGTQTRTRSCTPPSHGGYPCPSKSQSESRTCNNGPCPIDGGLSVWSGWTTCTASCGGGEHSRKRRCDSPAPDHGGKDCVGGLTETQVCNANPCPINGGLSDWDNWTTCPVSCGGGEQTQARRCDNPAPQYGGLDCVGDLSGIQQCNEDACPICKNGDVKLEQDGTPSIFWDNLWSPICGHYFWDNQDGATKFCQKMGYASGEHTRLDKAYSVDAFRLGKCNENDEWDTKCSGGCNDYEIGGSCSNSMFSAADCTVAGKVAMTITCSGKLNSISNPSCKVPTKNECKDKDESYCADYIKYYGDRMCVADWFIGDSGRYGCKKSCKLC